MSLIRWTCLGNYSHPLITLGILELSLLKYITTSILIELHIIRVICPKLKVKGGLERSSKSYCFCTATAIQTSCESLEKSHRRARTFFVERKSSPFSWSEALPHHRPSWHKGVLVVSKSIEKCLQKHKCSEFQVASPDTKYKMMCKADWFTFFSRVACNLRRKILAIRITLRLVPPQKELKLNRKIVLQVSWQSLDVWDEVLLCMSAVN